MGLRHPIHISTVEIISPPDLHTAHTHNTHTHTHTHTVLEGGEDPFTVIL